MSLLDALAGSATATFDVGTNPGQGVNAAVLNPGASILATAAGDGTVRLWDVATHQQIGTPITADSDPSSNGGSRGSLSSSLDLGGCVNLI